MTEARPKLWLPYPRKTLIEMRRCPDCGWSPKEQGHHQHCPTAAPPESNVHEPTQAATPLQEPNR